MNLKSIILFLIMSISFLKIIAQPTNLDFSSGTLNGWTMEEGGNQDSQTMSIYNIHASTQYSLMLPGATEINTVTAISMLSPMGGNFIRVGQPFTGGNAYKLSQTFTVDASSTSLAFSYAIVMDNGGHICTEQNYFNFTLKDAGGNVIPANSNNQSIINGTSCSSSDPSYLTSSHFGYKNWNTLSYNLTNYLGAAVSVEMTIAGCNMYQAAHAGYVYFDADFCNNTSTPTNIMVNGNTYPISQSTSTLNLCGSLPAVIWAPVGATNFTWTGGTINGATTQSVSITQPGMYSLQCNKPFACSNTTKVSFLLGSSPSLSISPSSTNTCEGTSKILSATGALSYTWATISGTSQSSGFNSNYNISPLVTSVYNLIGKNSNGCLSSINYTMPVIQGPLVSVSGNTLLCLAGSPTTLTALGADTYYWNTTGANTNSIVVSPTVNMSYAVTGSSSITGCSKTYNHYITVGANISINASKYKFCVGDTDSSKVFANGATSYTWSNGATTNSVALTPTITTTYTVSGMTSCGIKQAVITLTVNPLPNIQTTSPSTLSCPGLYVFLASGGTSYVWSNGMANNTTLYINSNTSHTVIGTDINGCKNTSVQSYTTLPVPTITVVISPTLICVGQQATLTAMGVSTYTWSNGANTSSTIVTPTVNTNYSINASDINGCAIYTVAPAVFVSAATPTFNFASTSYSFCANSAGFIQMVGSNTYSYSCGQAGTSIDVSTSNRYLGIQPPILTPTVYTVTATNGCGVYTKTVMASSNPLPTISISGPTVTCENSPITFTIGGVNSFNISSPSSVYTSSTMVTVTPTASTIYTVNGQGANYCYNTQTISVTVNNGLSVSASNYTICSGASQTFIANGANSYTWSTGGNTNSIVVTPTTSTIYTVTGSSSNGCAISNTISVTVNPYPTFTVNSGGVCLGSIFVINPTSTFFNNYTYSGGSPSVIPTTNANYTVYATNSYSCTTSAISSVTVNSIPTISVNSGSICSGQNFTMIPSGGTIYIYSNGNSVVNPTTTTNYTVTGGDANGCINTAISNVSVGAASMPITVNSGTICSGASFTIVPSGASTYTFSSGSNIISPSTNTVITVTGTDLNGCVDNVGALSSIFVNANPVITTSVSSGVICEGSSAALTANGTNTYSWSTGATSSSITITPTVNTTYTVIGMDLNNCISGQTVSVLVDNTCQDVWPGDANSDGWADNLDVLEMGLHYLQTGSARPAGLNNIWQSFYTNNWAGTITNGKNVNHSDCNGDGTINDDDTLAIFNNYGLNHAFRPNAQIVTIPELSIVPDQGYVAKGTWGSSSIYLGEVLTPVNNINGIAFTVNFDNALIEPNSIWIEYPNSFINTANQNLHFRKLDFATSSLFTATTHTINNDVSGNGLIGILHYKILSSLTTDEVLLLELFQGYKSETSGLITPLTTGTGTLLAIGASVGMQENTTGNLVSISPNPTNGSLTINSKTELQKIELIAVTGQILLSEVPISTSHTLHLDNLANSIYFVNVYQNNRIVKREKIILNK